MTILVLEDDAAVRHVVVRVLTARGHRCTEAAGLSDAARSMNECPPDAVLSDVDLGADDGIDACLELRSRRPGLPILMMTGDPASAQRIDAAGLGPALRKPFLMRELESALEAIGF